MWKNLKNSSSEAKNSDNEINKTLENSSTHNNQGSGQIIWKVFLKFPGIQTGSIWVYLNRPRIVIKRNFLLLYLSAFSLCPLRGNSWLKFINLISIKFKTSISPKFICGSLWVRRWYNLIYAQSRILGSGVLNPGAVFLRFVTEAFLLFLAPARGPNPAGQFSYPAGQSSTLK